MTYYPHGDPDGPADGYPGSIFGLGHDHQRMADKDEKSIIHVWKVT